MDYNDQFVEPTVGPILQKTPLVQILMGYTNFPPSPGPPFQTQALGQAFYLDLVGYQVWKNMVRYFMWNPTMMCPYQQTQH